MTVSDFDALRQLVLVKEVKEGVSAEIKLHLDH